MPRTAKARIFRSTQTVPNASTARDLTTAFGTAANTATTAAFPAAGAASFRWNPSVSATAAAPPAVGTAPSGQAWRDTVAENASEDVTYALGTWTVRVRANKTVMTINATVTVRITVIVYRVTASGGVPAGAPNNGEIGRIVMADTALPTVNAAVTITGSFATSVATPFAAGDKVQAECYVENIINNAPAPALAAYTVAFVVDEASANGASFTAIPAFDTRYARSQAVTAIGVAGATRRISAFRSAVVSAIGVRAMTREIRPLPKTVTAVGSVANPRKAVSTVPKTVTAVGSVANPRKAVSTVPKTVTAVGSVANPRKAVSTVPKTVTAVGAASMARRLTAAKSITTTAVGVAAMARAATYRKALVTTAVGVAAGARRLIMARASAVTALGVLGSSKIVGLRRSVSALGSSAMDRTVTASRTIAAESTGVAGFGRALVFGRRFPTTAVGAASGRIDMPITALNRIPPPGGTPDWPLNAPTKVIAGVTRDAVGAIVTGATVKLVRQSDDQRVAITTSDAVTGAYSFTRGGDDPNTYRVIATKAGVPEIHGVSDELVPA